MFRRNRSFLIDFNLSSKILLQTHAGTIPYASRRAHALDLRNPFDDMESFLYVLAGNVSRFSVFVVVVVLMQKVPLNFSNFFIFEMSGIQRSTLSI